MRRIQVKVTNQYGIFEGVIELVGNTTEKEAKETLQAIRDSINTISMLSIEHEDGSATVFPEGVLRQSVVNLKMIA